MEAQLSHSAPRWESLALTMLQFLSVSGPAYPPQVAVFPGHGFRKDAVNIKSNDAHALSLVTLSSIRGACGRHDIY